MKNLLYEKFSAQLSKWYKWVSIKLPVKCPVFVAVLWLLMSRISFGEQARAMVVVDIIELVFPLSFFSQCFFLLWQFNIFTFTTDKMFTLTTDFSSFFSSAPKCFCTTKTHNYCFWLSQITRKSITTSKSYRTLFEKTKNYAQIRKSQIGCETDEFHSRQGSRKYWTDYRMCWVRSKMRMHDTHNILCEIWRANLEWVYGTLHSCYTYTTIRFQWGIFTVLVVVVVVVVSCFMREWVPRYAVWNLLPIGSFTQQFQRNASAFLKISLTLSVLFFFFS